MAKRKAAKKATRKIVPKRRASSSRDRLRAILAKQTTEDLVQMIVDLSDDNSHILRQVQQRFKIEDTMTVEELVAATKVAISDATEVDEDRLNYNFDYDYKAYETVARNFMKLVALGHWKEVMELSVGLMHDGSYQVECSDEGLMTDEIQDCLLPVIKAIGKSGLKSADIDQWCKLMLATDRVKFICREELFALQAPALT